MPNPALSPDKVEAIRTLLMMGRDASGQRWTDKRIAEALGVTDRTIRKYRKALIRSGESLSRSRADVMANAEEIRSLIGLDE